MTKAIRILILGGDGMLGHQLLRSWAPRHDVRVTLRKARGEYSRFGLFTERNSIDRIDAFDQARLTALLFEQRPDVVVNGIGIVKQRSDAKAAIPSITINALLPHQLLDASQAIGARFVQISTDCVFSGRNGHYLETDIPDPVDLYGRSKLLGEVHAAPGLTVRSSIIGLELSRFTGLVEWFLAQRGTIRGFTRAIYSGVTTREMARVIEHVLVHAPDLHGVWQVASAPISKYELLRRLSDRLGRTDVDIEPDETFACDRSLSGDAFARETGYVVSSWDVMLDELAEEIRARVSSAVEA